MKRKRMIIDRKFQIRSIVGVAVITGLFFTAAAVVTGYYSVMNRGDMAAEIGMLREAVETQDNIVRAFIEYAKAGGRGRVKLSVDAVAGDHAKSMEAMQGHIERLGMYADDFNRLVLITIGIAFLAVLACSIYMVRLTHRISGPLFVMSRHIQEMIDGREPQFRSLREKDEFKEMYARLVELGGKMKGK
jgi:hypothetical protein